MQIPGLKILNLFFFFLLLFPNTAFSQSVIKIQATLSGTGTRQLSDYWGVNGNNVTDPGLGWDNDSLPGKINQLNASTIRFPGGTNSNWWDWKTGGYIEGNTIHMGDCFGLPPEYGSIFKQNINTLDKFKLSIDQIGAKPVFVLNMLSSTLADQLAMLQEAQIQGFGLNEIELGNEFHLDYCEYKSAFNDGKKYGEIAGVWTQEIRKRLSNVKIAFAGARTDTSDVIRRKNWNADMISAINNLSNNAKPDAYVIHQYKTTGFGSRSSCGSIRFTDPVKVNCNAEKWQLFFFNSVVAIDNISSQDMSVLTQGYNKPFWFTEYNLLDRDYYIHGSWAHALHTAAMTLAFLDKSTIQHLNSHSFFGNAVFSALFSDTNGLTYSTNVDNPFCIVPPPSNIKTGPFTLSSEGYALTEIGMALKHALVANKINFSGQMQKLYSCNSNASAKDGLLGWTFSDTTGNQQIILLNLSSDTLNLSFPSGGNAIQAPQYYKSFAFDLYAYIYNTASNGNIQHIDLNPSSLTYSTSIETNCPVIAFNDSAIIPPFSITRFWSYDQTKITAVAQNNPVCAGNSVILQTIGDPGFYDYQWYRNGIEIQGANTSIINTTPQSDTLNVYYIVAKNNSGIIIQSDDLIVQTRPVPVVIISDTLPVNICKGTIKDLSGYATGGSDSVYAYTWYPEKWVTAGNALSNRISITPSENTQYVLYASDGICSAKSETVDVIVLDNFEIDSINSLCNNLPSQTILLQVPDPPSGITANYLWNTGAITQNILIPSITNPYYSVTVTYYNDSGQEICSAFRKANIYLASCCNTLYNLGTNKNSRDFVNYVRSICNSCVTDSSNGKFIIDGSLLSSPRPVIGVSGTFTMDENLQIKSFIFEMAEGSRFVIPEYHTLTLSVCRFHACSNGKLWQGFYVSKFGNINISSSSSIENARHAIELDDFTSIKITNSNIKNNYIGIYYNGPGMNSTSKYSLVNFSCDFVPLKTKYNWMPENPGTNGIAGIWINNVAGSKGNPVINTTSNTITFTNLINNIVVNGSFGNKYDSLNNILARPSTGLAVPVIVSGNEEEK